MSFGSEKRPYATHAKALITIAQACRDLEISRQTLLKWEALGYITLTVIGPAEAPIRRVPRSEIDRIKKTA